MKQICGSLDKTTNLLYTCSTLLTVSGVAACLNTIALGGCSSQWNLWVNNCSESISLVY